MISVTTKVSRFKIAVILIAVIAAVTVGIVFVVRAKALPAEKNAETAAQRVQFLKQFGWEADAATETHKIVNIPVEFDDVYKNYNEIQKSQGYDLQKYAGKQVDSYQIEVKNYPESKGVIFGNLLVFEGRVIGGDICDSAINGVMHGFDLTGTGFPLGQKATE